MAETGLQRIEKMVSTTGVSAVPIKEFPMPPEAMLKFGPPEFRAAIMQWAKEIDEWRKTLPVR